MTSTISAPRASAPIASAPAVQAGALPVRSMFDTMQLFKDRSWANSLKLKGGNTLGSAIDSTLAFKLEGAGSMTSRKFVPASPAAQEAVQGEGGQRILQMLHGLLPSLEGRETNQRLQGVLLPITRDQLDASYGALVVNQLNGFGMRPVALNEKPAKHEVKDLKGALKVAHKTGNFGGVSDVVGGWFLVAPWAAAPLVDMLNKGATNSKADQEIGMRATSLLLHESEHLDAPRGNDKYVDPPGYMKKVSPNILGKLPAPVLRKLMNMFTPPQMWLEEAGADVAATYNDNRFNQAATNMGLPFDPKATVADRLAYPQLREGISELFTLGGIDLKTETGFNTAVDLLQNQAKSALDVPKLLAQRIATTHKLGAEDQAKIADLIGVAGKGRSPKGAPKLNKSITAIKKIVGA